MSNLSNKNSLFPADQPNIPLLHTTYEFYKLFHQNLKLFPKAEKYSLGQRIENFILDMLELVIRAAYTPKATRLLYLEDLDTKVQLLKTLIRLAHEVRALDDKKYLALQEPLQEIGKMIGGWLRSVKGSASGYPVPSTRANE